MRRTLSVAKRIAVVVTMAALLTLVAAVLTPIDAARGAEGGCGSMAPLAANAADALFATPLHQPRGAAPVETAAPAEVRYPGEAALWTPLVDRGLMRRESLVLAANHTISSTSATFLSSAPRPDRPISDSVVRLYCGLLGHAPDPFELEYWTERYRSGLSLATMAGSFTASGEFISRFGYPEAPAVVPLLFEKVLRRDPGPGAVDRWVDALRVGEVGLGEVIVGFTESPEFVTMTGTVAPSPPLVPYPQAGEGKRIIYSNSAQRVWLIEDSGELTKTHLVSGRRGVPRAGDYRVYSKSVNAWAPYDGITMHYMVRFARGEWPYGFHSLPVRPGAKPLQTLEQLGTFRSGGCVRQTWDDAVFVYDWAELGTPVIVLP